MSKYRKLWDYIVELNKDNCRLSFEEIKNILEDEIDHSFLKYKKELEMYGYKVNKISMKEKYVDFVKRGD